MVWKWKQRIKNLIKCAILTIYNLIQYRFKNKILIIVFFFYLLMIIFRDRRAYVSFYGAKYRNAN